MGGEGAGREQGRMTGCMAWRKERTERTRKGDRGEFIVLYVKNFFFFYCLALGQRIKM